MRAHSCLCCLLLALLLAAAPLLPIAISQAQPGAAEPGNDMAPAPDDDEEEAGNDTAEREERPAPSATRRGDQLGLVRRADGFDPDADETSGTKPPHPLQLAHPDYDVVVCEAGCDGPAGAIVYLQKRQPRQVE
ncbi:MAG TPA: hypothetical protein VN523_04930 [Hyphomicrobiaceae bacterium]|jgi:hypothetical protein|nr:hypothetical protein [Hyphomicrobiaceae bacterium]